MTRLLSLLSVALVSASLVAACHSGPAAPPAQPASAAALPSGQATTAQDQIAQGKTLYVGACAKCHGNAGEGTKDGPPVVGKDAFPLHPRSGAKRDVDFHTAADVFAWTTKHMPADNPGGLATEQYLAIFAFDLTANGIALDAPLDGAKAQATVLHP